MVSYREIANADLREADIPASSQAPEIWQFAHSFDGYAPYAGFAGARYPRSKMMRYIKACRARFERDGGLPDTLTAMRICLYFEARQYRWHRQKMGETAMDGFYGSAWVDALLDGMRQKIRTGQID
jgi:hypothetical protein